MGGGAVEAFAAGAFFPLRRRCAGVVDDTARLVHDGQHRHFCHVLWRLWEGIVDPRTTMFRLPFRMCSWIMRLHCDEH